ncbi:probable carboxylesterase 12 [Ziziphus jujuba]|uniref:Probable carboxylesterase 12 n=1 Tax=Ziziphus jujuba TaxID=326968 RepID=A0ABM3ZSV8_ZIZJJ|nr:probable carboxylesterase 12 [Ziziphus jujuba]
MTNEIAHDLSPFLRLYKDGRVERLKGTDVVPPSLDPKTGVESKDVVISAETGLSVRLYIPKTAINAPKKLPLLVYFHGGGFCIETAASPTYHNYLNPLVGQANIVAVSVDYRRAPEHPVPVAYDYSWEALKWVSSHVQGQGSSEWLNSHADLENVFFSGDSAGANIANNMAIRVGLSEEKIGIKLRGIILVHPYFWGKELVGEEAHGPEVKAMIDNFWLLACPSSTGGSDDPFINPEKDPNLGRLGCERVLVCIAEKDIFKERGRHYVELVEKSGWGGTVELMEAKGEDHVFHLFNHNCENAIAMLNKIVSFIFFQQKNI